MNFTIHKAMLALRSRLARNIYLWALLLYFVITLNFNNERLYQHAVTGSSWYYPVLAISTLFQMTLLYVNNLVLVPRFLSQRKYLKYFGLMLLLVAGISVIYTIGLKIAKPHLDVDHMQQIGFVSAPVTKAWSFTALRQEAETYLSGNMLWILIFTMAWYMNDYTRQRRVADEAKRAQVTTELAFLKSQLNPHFLFNTLNNLYALTLKKADNAPDAVLKLSAILRYLLYESNTALVPFEQEKEIMQAYIDLELLRLKNKDHLHFSISSDSTKPIPPLLWLPVLENIFKHGTRIISNDNFVDYRFTVQGNELMIYSRNSAKNTPEQEATKGIGLQNLRKRLALLFPGKYQLISHQQQNEYITEIKINLL